MSTETHKPLAWMHEDGRVVRAETMEHARRGGGAMLSSLAGYTIPLYGPDALAAERERCADAVRSAPNGCALGDNRAYVERFRHALLDVIEGPNVNVQP